MISIEIVVNDDGTHTLQVTGSPEDVAAIAAYLTVSIQAVQEVAEEEKSEQGGDDLVS